MLSDLLLLGDCILPDCILTNGAILIHNGRIAAIGPRVSIAPYGGPHVRRIEHDGYLSPGFVDLHVHGGGGADFMDGTPAAFATALAAHLRHGTTSIVPTTTVARHEQTLDMLETCERFRNPPANVNENVQRLPRVLGAHLYGPHFRYEARGCHPGDPLHTPLEREEAELLEHSTTILTATIAPEIASAERFARACAQHGIRLNVGHSLATFNQVEQAVSWGVRHADHLYCAMSDKTKLRALQPYPMQGGLLEATLAIDALTTEVIADGKHLSADLLWLAYKIKGADRLALVTDCNRALNMPEGNYLFGPLDGGEPFLHRDGVGLMPDGKGLASSASGMDHMVRTCFAQLTDRGVPLHEVIRMASLTPARIIGRAEEIGSLDVGKRADVLMLDRDLQLQQVLIDGVEAWAG